MGAGKSKQCIDAAQILFEHGIIDHVLVVSPAAVRGVWFDRDLGELKKHLWEGSHHKITEFHARQRVWIFESDQHALRWTISNYEFIRAKPRLLQLVKLCGPKTLLVLDESSAVKNHKAEQTKACMQLRRACGRVVLLNGTPIANNPGDLYAQGQILSKTILECKTWFEFRSRYANMGGFNSKQIVSWRNLEDIQRRFAPYTLRRLKVDCLDLPDKLPPVVLTVPLNHKTWGIYREMRDEMVAWLTQTTVSVASQAVVKALRLAQITSGFVGGVEDAEPRDSSFDFETDLTDLYLARPSFIPRTSTNLDDQNPGHETSPLNTISLPTLSRAAGDQKPFTPVQEIGREKLDAYLEWVAARLEEDQNLKLLTWCRFRPELSRTLEELKKRFPQVTCGAIWGGQSRDRYRMLEGKQTLVREGERDAAIRLLDPRTTPDGPVVVIGTTATGALGLNLTAAHTVIYLSNDFSLKTRLQSEDRVHRPGQVHHVSYTDVLATGPNGQKTVDHIVLKALRNKENLATWTTSAWVQALTEE